MVIKTSLLGAFFFFSISLVEADNILLSEPISPIPEVLGLDKAKVALGKLLFHDPKLSRNGTVSCSSCHPLEKSGVDGLPISIGIDQKLGIRNTPTVLNSSLSFRQFWDGKAANLAEQVSGPILNKVEMGTKWASVINYLKSNPLYREAFLKSYKVLPTKNTVASAIAEFEKSLLTPNGAFDQYLKGDNLAISEQAKQGYKLFKSYGCISCHQGVAVGGNLYEKLGIVTPYFDESTATISDLGRYNITRNPEHKFEFKVPSLRNVVRTAPYLHNGSVKTIESIVALMAKHQLGRELSKKQVADIVSFLETLNGEYIENN